MGLYLNHETEKRYKTGDTFVINADNPKRRELEWIIPPFKPETGNGQNKLEANNLVIWSDRNHENVDAPKFFYMAFQAYENMRHHDKSFEQIFAEASRLQLSFDADGGIKCTYLTELMGIPPNEDVPYQAINYLLKRGVWKDRVPATLSASAFMYYTKSERDPSGWAFYSETQAEHTPISGWELASKVIAYHMSENGKVYAMIQFIHAGKYRAEIGFLLQEVPLSGYDTLPEAESILCIDQLGFSRTTLVRLAKQKSREPLVFNIFTDRFSPKPMNEEKLAQCAVVLRSKERSQSMESQMYVVGISEKEPPTQPRDGIITE